ncbi:MAG: hypothetical protein ACFFCE_01615 [Promethearchaeota archaeon]
MIENKKYFYSLESVRNFFLDDTCIVCHKIIDDREGEIITCHFCGNKAHSKCIRD